MPGAHEARDELPVARDAERPVPTARRQKSGSAEGQSQRLETWDAVATECLAQAGAARPARDPSIALAGDTRVELLRNPDELARLIAMNAPAGLAGASFGARDWLDNPANFALVDGEDLGLFEAGDAWPGPLTAHVLFASRGAKALRVARTMLAQAFAFGATRILGETPANLPHALLFARMLGFVIDGEAEREMGRVVLATLPRHG